MNKIEWTVNAFIAICVAGFTSLLMLIVSGHPVGYPTFLWYCFVSMVVNTIIDLRK
jgi:hypothetical protein